MNTGNDTFDLYASGGSLVDRLNQEFSEKLTRVERARKVPTDDSVVALAAAVLNLKQGKVGVNDVMRCAIDAKDKLSTTDIRMVQLLKESGELGHIGEQALNDIFCHFANKISHKPTAPTVEKVVVDGTWLIRSYSDGSDVCEKYRSGFEANTALSEVKNEM